MTPEPSPSPTQLIIPSPGAVTWDIVAQWVAIGILIACTVAVIFFVFNYLPKVKKIKPFYASIAAVAVLGGVFAFLLPVAFNSGFGKDDDGRVLRQLILYTTGGLLGVITLGETHRRNNQEKEKNENDHIRQVHAERRSRYTTAVEQLANEKAPVRRGGIYTLVSLADEWLADNTLNPKERQKEGQVIINNLCAYIRSPFPHAELRMRFEKDNSEENIPEEDRDEFLKKQAQFREEQDIRQTILTEITDRLGSENMKTKNGKQVPQKGPWSDFTYNFSGSFFLYNVNFRNVVVTCPINFSRSVFGQVVSFYNSIFEGEVFFGGSIFEKTPSFIKTDFKKSSSFHGAEFKSGVNFKKSTFNGSTIFQDAIFSSPTSFASTHFEEKADFKDARFTGHTSFSGATFKKEAIFTDAIFKKNISHAVNSSTITTDFNGATFENIADFRNAYFEGFSNFVNANFEGDTRFINTTFKVFDKLADFTDTKFIGSATFAKSIFFGPTCFHGARFINKEPRFGAQDSSLLAARFSCSVTPESYIFGVSSHSPYKIQLGQSEINGKKFIVPEGTILFDPKSWDEENKKYTRVSGPAKPLDKSNDSKEEKPAE